MVTKKEEKEFINAIQHREEWEMTRRMYSLLCTLASMTLLLMERLEKRMAMHGLYFKHETKYKYNRACENIKAARKLMDEIDEMNGYLGRIDYARFWTLIRKEGYQNLRVMMMWNNATWKASEEQIAEMESDLNKLSTGKPRMFSKKMIDTFKLNA